MESIVTLSISDMKPTIGAIFVIINIAFFTVQSFELNKSSFKIEESKVPYLVSISTRNFIYGDYKKFLCSGTILDESWILAPSGCVFEKHYLTVKTANPYHNTIPVKTVHHVMTQHGPLALVELLFPMQFNQNVQPIPIIRKSEFVEGFGGRGQISGWGWYDDYGSEWNQWRLINGDSLKKFQYSANTSLIIIGHNKDIMKRIYPCLITYGLPLKSRHSFSEYGSPLVMNGSLVAINREYTNCGGSLTFFVPTDKKHEYTTYTQLYTLRPLLNKYIPNSNATNEMEPVLDITFVMEKHFIFSPHSNDHDESWECNLTVLFFDEKMEKHRVVSPENMAFQLIELLTQQIVQTLNKFITPHDDNFDGYLKYLNTTHQGVSENDYILDIDSEGNDTDIFRFKEKSFKNYDKNYDNHPDKSFQSNYKYTVNLKAFNSTNIPEEVDFMWFEDTAVEMGILCSWVISKKIEDAHSYPIYSTTTSHPTTTSSPYRNKE